MDSEEFINAFKAVKEFGWINSHRRGNTGVGKTFEDAIGVMENNNDAPDLFGFEIKTHREMPTDSYITLFTKAPDIPQQGANKSLLEKCGNVDNGYPVLHASVFANRSSRIYNKFDFQLIDMQDSINLLVKDLNGKIIFENIGWTMSTLKKRVKKKLENLAFVSVGVDRTENIEKFKYNKCVLYYNVSFKKFIKYIRLGLIMVDIRLGTYRSGKKVGKIHDHGTAFRIKKEHIPKLYNNYRFIE